MCILSFFILSLLITQSIASKVDEFFPEERDALMQLRDFVNSTFNLHVNWTGPPCNEKNRSRWFGITCSDWHVTHLVLEGINLTGSLPSAFLQNLTFLSNLSFTNNSLHGPLPNLTNLMHLEFVLLSRNRFSGSIPSSYIDLPKLTRLELQENGLSGRIPPFNQQSLMAFNVSNNELEGPIPETHVLHRFSNSSYGNNLALCGEIAGVSPCPVAVPQGFAPFAPPSREKDGRILQAWSIALIAATAALVIVSIVLISLCYYRRIYREKRKQEQVVHQPEEASIQPLRKGSYWSENEDDQEKSLELVFLDKPFFELDDLLRAAGQVLGSGKLGTTYKAVLECGSVVAVKRLKETNTLSKKEFMQHMHLIGNTKHENLAQIISFYQSKDEKLIVYEYVPNESLFTLLHENRGTGRRALSWNTRVSIIKQIAKGVDFLHRRLGSQRVPHGNLKSSNILIHFNQTNNNNNVRIEVKLTDYGLLPLVSPHKLAIGITPEVRERKRVTSKADVYCFGILVLEIVTGKIPCCNEVDDGNKDDDDDENDNKDLSGWVRKSVNCDWSTDILDVEILGETEGYDEMLKLTEIALDCTDEVPERRPNMSQVLARIHA